MLRFALCFYSFPNILKKERKKKERITFFYDPFGHTGVSIFRSLLTSETFLIVIVSLYIAKKRTFHYHDNPAGNGLLGFNPFIPSGLFYLNTWYSSFPV